MRILIAEDEPVVRQIVGRVLKQVGHEVVAAENGQAAWELFQRERFPMVITDLVMPEMDGLDLIRKIRAAGQEPYAYILILTVITEPKYVMMGQEAGADDYLTKPVDTLELLARVRIGERFLKMAARLREALRKAGEDSEESSA
ncbi:MAG TPA: response regulator [Anaerolineales bacterium]|nr:response regulator [Anaerolineales bacterium]